MFSSFPSYDGVKFPFGLKVTNRTQKFPMFSHAIHQDFWMDDVQFFSTDTPSVPQVTNIVKECTL